MTDWTTVQLRDVCDSVDYGLTASSSLEDSGVHFLRITDIVNNSFSWKSVPFVNTSPDNAKKYRINPGDIVIARTGATTGESRWIGDVPSDVVFASYLVRFKVSKDHNSRFIGYALKSDQYWNYIRGVLSEKSAQPNASAKTLSAAPIKIPFNVFEQHAVAEILGALDDKIAVNERIANTTLALADSLFASKAAGVKFGEETFGSIARVGGGGTPKTKEVDYWGGDVAWATPKDITALDSPYLFETSRTITQLGLENCASALYPAQSIFMTSRATIGAFAIPQIPTAVNQGFIVVLPPTEDLRWWLFHEMRSRVDEMLSLANGSTFLELSRKNFKAMPVRIPEPEVIRRFSSRVKPLHESARNAASESHTLAELRDTLLPQLMSGKLRVKDAEKIVEDNA